jgi:hypothetical protein
MRWRGRRGRTTETRRMGTRQYQEILAEDKRTGKKSKPR